MAIAKSTVTAGAHSAERIRVCRTDDGRHVLLDEACAIGEANGFLEAIEMRGLSRHTVRSYAYDLLLLYRWLLESDEKLCQLTAAKLVQFVASQRRNDASPRSINRRLSTIRLLYRFHFGSDPGGSHVSLPAPHYKGPGRDHDLGLHALRKRPALQLRVKESRKLVEPLSPDQVRAFFGEVTRYRDLAIVHLMLLCGLRTCEVMRLEMSDLSFRDQKLLIRGKGGRERVIPLPQMLAQALRQYIAFERPSPCTHLLFVVLQGPRRGSPLTAAGLRSLFRHRRQLALLASANAHRFRHTFGTDMARAGVRLPVLQKMMGHADAKTTLQYIQLSMADIAEEYRRAMRELDKRYGRK
jgi:site-specific recombinase XerD